MRIYFGDFESKSDIADKFDIDPRDIATHSILFACYGGNGNYDGHALVILRDAKGDLFEVNGSHCSCHGLEGQWELEHTTWASLKLRLEKGTLGDEWTHPDEPDARDALRALVMREYARSVPN